MKYDHAHQSHERIKLSRGSINPLVRGGAAINLALEVKVQDPMSAEDYFYRLGFTIIRIGISSTKLRVRQFQDRRSADVSCCAG